MREFLPPDDDIVDESFAASQGRERAALHAEEVMRECEGQSPLTITDKLNKRRSAVEHEVEILHRAGMPPGDIDAYRRAWISEYDRATSRWRAAAKLTEVRFGKYTVLSNVIDKPKEID